MRRRVGNLEQHALERIEHLADTFVSRLQGRLSIEPICGDEISRADLFVFDIRDACGIGIQQLEQHHLGLIEVIANGNDEDAIRVPGREGRVRGLHGRRR